MSEKEITVPTEESFADGDITRWDFFVVKLTGREAFLITKLK